MVENIESNGPEAAKCVHHFIVSAPVDNVATGTCKKCNFIRQFTQPSHEAVIDAFLTKSVKLQESIKKTHGDSKKLQTDPKK